MILTRLLSASLLALVGLALVALPASARGGRYGAPAGPREATETEEPAPPPATDAEPTEPQATPVPPTLAPPTPNGIGARGPGRRLSQPSLGIVDWVHWYEVNRERFENLRGVLLTDTNPMFAVGGAAGPGVGHATIRIGDPARDEIREAAFRALHSESGNWLHTEGAAYVALGKVAATTPDLQRHFAALEKPDSASRFVQDSAVLGLAHLGRSEVTRRLPASLLDRARELLLKVLGDDGYGYRSRAFAAVALGLLADQPTFLEEGGTAWTADHLFRTWTTSELPDEVQVGILLGLSELDGQDVPRVVPLVLEGCALRGRQWPRPVSGVVRAHTVIALAHLGDAKHAPTIAALLGKSDGETPLLRQAAAIAAAVLGERHVGSRALLGEALLDALDSRPEPGARHLAWIALGRLLAADVARADTALLELHGAGKRLLKCAAKGSPAERSFAAMALALAASPVEPAVDSAAWQMFRFQALEALRGGIESKRNGTHTRAAFCVALGLTGDRQSGEKLLSLLSDTDQDPELRAYAALALGLTRDARTGVVPALTKALAETRSDMLRTRASTALGLLGAGSLEERKASIRILLDAMRTSRSQVGKAQIAITLGRLGDATVVEPLLKLLEDAKEPHLNRAIACAALGLVGAEELTPALAGLRERCHYMSGSNVVFELLDLL